MKNKIYIGTFRPTFEDLKRNLQGKDSLYFHCKCLRPEIAGISYCDLIHHWSQGHFDEPVYKEVCDHHWSELQKELIDSWALNDDSVKFYYQTCYKCGEIKILG